MITAPRDAGPRFQPSYGMIHFAASAQHTGGLEIERVEFWLDYRLVGTDTTAPYEMEWEVGSNTRDHVLNARAYDVNGLSSTSGSVSFDLIIPPSITLTPPGGGATVVPGAATVIAANVSEGNHSIKEVRFFVNNALQEIDTTAPYSVEWTPAAAGTYKIAASVEDTRYVKRSAPEITVAAGYSAQQQWLFAHFGTYISAGQSADDADPDGDGLVNLIEWMLAGDPALANPGLRPELAVNGTDAVFTFTRNDAAEANATFFACWSADLQTWHEVPVSVVSSAPDADGVTVTVEENGAAPDTITVTIPRSNGAADKLFVRLRATSP